MGLAEAHQALVVNGLRTAVQLRVGGGIKNGYDVVKYALFGADAVQLRPGADGVGRVHRVQELPHPELPDRDHRQPRDLQGPPGAHQGVPAAAWPRRPGSCSPRWASRTSARSSAAATCWRERTRSCPAGRRSWTCRSSSARTWPWSAWTSTSRRRRRASACCARRPTKSLEPRGSSRRPDDAIDTVPERRPGVPHPELGPLGRGDGRRPDRQALRPGGDAEPPAGSRCGFEGEAGQSFGAWCVNGLDLELRGFAQDGVAKGISGGHVVVTLDYTASDYGGEIQSVAGNNVGYGATGGTIFIGGRAGHRLGIRNSRGDDRGRGRRQVRLRVHDPRPGADPGAGRERDRLGHDRRRAVRVRPGQRGAGEAAHARAWR